MVAVQIRDVPDEVRDALVADAEQRGQSLQAYLMDVLEHQARMARNRLWLARMRGNPVARVTGDESTPELIRRLREERTQQILDAVDRSEPASR